MEKVILGNVVSNTIMLSQAVEQTFVFERFRRTTLLYTMYVKKKVSLPSI